MLMWLLVMVVAMYLPLNVQRRFGAGLMIPVAYFATRAVEDVWLPRISRRWRPVVACVFVPLISVSLVLMLFLPVLPAITGYPQAVVGVFLESDYAAAYHWLETRASETDVVLASPLASAWVPGWAGARVVYGHPYETLGANEKQQQVLDWYNGADEGAACAALLEQYHVRYVLYGPEEQKLGSSACLSGLSLIAQSGSVSIYAP
jgi:hypothetical protein